ncbi:MAG: response regulator [Desulfobacterales bacterium]|nr:response regulator [Desulfobacterales bacterium]MCP4163350.1 response regulator [Deltaproteobacteria bacterium]
MRILIVEDEELIIKVMNKTFSFYGECEIAKNSKEAMMLYLAGIEKNTPFGLILLDIALSSGSGLSVLKQIRKREKKAGAKSHKEGVKIIMTTGNRKESVVKESIASGCNGYLLKPLNPKMVKEILQKLKITPLKNSDS